MIYTYECPVHGYFDSVSTMDTRNEPQLCPTCGELSNRVITAVPFHLEGVSGHFPTAADRWANLHEREGRKEPS